MGTDKWKKSPEARDTINSIVTDTTRALENGEGCKLTGFVFINKVPGNFHISGHHYPEAI